MPNNWKTYKLGELYKTASGLSKSSKEFGFGNPFVTFKNVFYNYFLPTELDSLVNTNEKEIKSCSVKKGDVFLTRTSETLNELGMSSVALIDYPNATFNGFCKRLRLLDNSPINIDPIFFGFYLRSDKFRNEVTKLASITTRASLNNDAIYSIAVTLPDFHEQIEIGKILKSINDKIENNLAINKTLEEMAMALYKHWFVDFGPFQDGEFVESGLGMIPKGWEVKRLEEICNITIGRTPPRKESQWFSSYEGVKWISIKDLGNSGIYISETSEYLTEEAVNKFNIPVIQPNTVILSFKLTVGRVAISSERMLSNEAIAHLNRKDKNLPVEFLYSYLKCFDYNSLGSTSSIATAVNTQTIKAMKIIVPKTNQLEKYFEKVNSIFEQIKSNQSENQTLTQLRDTLLPKLISGEVRLKEFISSDK